MMCAKIKGPGCSSVCCNAVTSVCFQMLQHGASNVKSQEFILIFVPLKQGLCPDVFYAK